jgi:hypothetical protein
MEYMGLWYITTLISRCFGFFLLLIFCTADSVPGIYTYDAEGDADNAVCQYLQDRGNVNSNTIVAKRLRDKWWSWKVYEGMSSSALTKSKL